MANTITSITVYGGTTTKRKWILYRCISDGTALSSGLVFTNSSQGTGTATAGAVESVQFSGKTTGGVRLEWKQTTNSPIISVGPNETVVHADYERFLGIPNPGATGATGDVVVTAPSIASGDEFTILLKIRQDS